MNGADRVGWKPAPAVLELPGDGEAVRVLCAEATAILGASYGLLELVQDLDAIGYPLELRRLRSLSRSSRALPLELARALERVRLFLHTCGRAPSRAYEEPGSVLPDTMRIRGAQRSSFGMVEESGEG